MKWLYRGSILSFLLMCGVSGCHFAEAVKDVQDGTINVPAGLVGAARALAGDPTGVLEFGGVALSFLGVAFFGHKTTKKSALQIATDTVAAAIAQLRAELATAAIPSLSIPIVNNPPTPPAQEKPPSVPTA